MDEKEKESDSGDKTPSARPSGAVAPPSKARVSVSVTASKETWNLLSGSAASIIAREALTRPSEVGLHRQPKSLLALGPDGFLKHRQKERELREHAGVAVGAGANAAGASAGAGPEKKPDVTKKSLPTTGGARGESGSNAGLGGTAGRDRDAEDRRSTLLQFDGGASSSGSLISGASGATVAGRKGKEPSRAPSNASSEDLDIGGRASKESIDDAYDIFQDEDEFNGLDNEEEQNVLEMANIEIDVNEEHAVMDTTLKKMLSEARTTSSEKTILTDKFNLMLQALVSFQESEVELIDHLRSKMSIMEVLKSFIANEVPVGSAKAAEQEEMPDDEGGIPGAFPTPGSKAAETPGESEEGQEEAAAMAAQASMMAGAPPGVQGTLAFALAAHKTFKTTQGISIDEMSAVTVRETLLVQKNKLEMQDHFKVLQLLELKQLEFEKALLTMHYGQMVKPSDLQKELKDLRKIVNDLQSEVVGTQQDITQMQNEFTNQEKYVREDESKLEVLEMDLTSKQMNIERSAKIPARMSHEAERVELELEQLHEHFDALCGRWMEGMETINLIQETITAKHAEVADLAQEVGRMQNSRKMSMVESDTLTIQYLSLKKREHALTEKREAAMHRANTAIKERRHLAKELHKMQKKVTTSHHEINRFEHAIRVATDSYVNAKLACDKLRVAVAALKPQQEGNNNWSKLSHIFRREIKLLKMMLSNKMEDAHYETENVRRLEEKLNELYDEQVDAGKELQDLIRITVRKRRERQDKSEQCIKLESQASKLLADKKLQKLVLDECGRTEGELYHSMDHVRRSYNKVKIERASLINDLFQTKQRLTEQNEKFKICNNEIDSYNNQCLDRVREIQRVHFINLNAGLRRDSVKNEALRVIDKCRLAKKERDELALTNRTLRKEVERQKADIADVRVTFEEAITAAHKAAIKVRERTEEVCTFIEKVKEYELVILKNKAELNERDNERIKLQSLLDEVKKHLLIIVANQPDLGSLFAEAEKLRARFYEVSDERRATEIELNDVTNKNRVREIHHELITKRETVPLLEEKVKLLEENLATRDCLSLERELILKQIDELTEQSMDKANYLRTTYANDVQELVSLRKALYHIATQIDGMICETSIAAAQADTAEKTFHSLYAQIDEAEQRFEDGLAPTEGMEEEMKRILWREEMLRRAREHSDHLKRTNYKVQRKPYRGTGAQIVMERFRPKKSKASVENKLELMEADTIPQLSPSIARSTRTCEARATRKYMRSKWAQALGGGRVGAMSRPWDADGDACRSSGGGPRNVRPREHGLRTGIPFCYSPSASATPARYRTHAHAHAHAHVEQ